MTIRTMALLSVLAVLETAVAGGGEPVRYEFRSTPVPEVGDRLSEWTGADVVLQDIVMRFKQLTVVGGVAETPGEAANQVMEALRNIGVGVVWNERGEIELLQVELMADMTTPVLGADVSTADRVDVGCFVTKVFRLEYTRAPEFSAQIDPLLGDYVLMDGDGELLTVTADVRTCQRIELLLGAMDVADRDPGSRALSEQLSGRVDSEALREGSPVPLLEAVELLGALAGKPVQPIDIALIGRAEIVLPELVEQPSAAAAQICQALREADCCVIAYEELIVVQSIQWPGRLPTPTLLADQPVGERHAPGTFITKLFAVDGMDAEVVASVLSTRLPEYARMAVDTRTQQIVLVADVETCRYVESLLANGGTR